MLKLRGFLDFGPTRSLLQSCSSKHASAMIKIASIRALQKAEYRVRETVMIPNRKIAIHL